MLFRVEDERMVPIRLKELRASSLSISILCLQVSLSISNHWRQTQHIVIRSDTSLFLLSLLSLLPSVPVSFPLLQTFSMCALLSLALSLTLTLPDSVSMLSHTNPPLRGVKALLHTHSCSPDPVRYWSAVPYALMGFFTPQHHKCLMRCITSDVVSSADLHALTCTLSYTGMITRG